MGQLACVVRMYGIPRLERALGGMGHMLNGPETQKGDLGNGGGSCTVHSRTRGKERGEALRPREWGILVVVVLTIIVKAIHLKG